MRVVPARLCRQICRYLFSGALLAIAILSAGCETQFEPFAESDAKFTILGFLDTDANRQFVRIVAQRPVVQRSVSLDADVRSINLTDGTTVKWTDSLVTFPDESPGHVFWADFPAIPGHRYRLEVTRSDGFTASAETTVPLRPGDPDLVYGVLNESAGFAPLYWPGVEEVVEADVLYELTPYGCFGKSGKQMTPGQRITHRFLYEGDARGRRTINDEWYFELDLWRDHQVLVEKSGVVGPFCAVLHKLEIRLASPSIEFDPPGGVWDPEVLVQPGTISNVSGGFGFLGSVARTTVNWQLSAVAMQELRYDYDTSQTGTPLLSTAK